MVTSIGQDSDEQPDSSQSLFELLKSEQMIQV